MPRLLGVAAIGIVCLLCGPSGVNASTKAHSLTSRQICDAIHHPVLAAAVTALTELLPAKYQPSKTLKIIVGAAAALCPQLAGTAVKVGQVFVRQTRAASPASPQASVTAPVTSLMASRTMDIQTGSAYAFVSWFGVGVSRYQEQTSASGSLDNPVLVGGLLPSVFRPVVPGGVYQFFVRGLDGQNQAVTSWAYSAKFSLSVFDTKLNDNGWRTSPTGNAYGGTIAYGTVPSASTITYTLDGFAMAIAAPTFPGGGEADVAVDGNFVRRIYLASSALEPGRLVFSWSWFKGGQHQVVLTPIRGEVGLDALLVLSFA